MRGRELRTVRGFKSTRTSKWRRALGWRTYPEQRKTWQIEGAQRSNVSCERAWLPLTFHGPGIEGTLGSLEKRPHNIANLPTALCNLMLGKWERTSFQACGVSADASTNKTQGAVMTVVRLERAEVTQWVGLLPQQAPQWPEGMQITLWIFP